MTVRSFISVLVTATASNVASSLVPLSLAINMSKCLQLGPCRCKGGHFPYGRDIILGITSSVVMRSVEIGGAKKPTAENMLRDIR
jgi:hypothetical protein